MQTKQILIIFGLFIISSIWAGTALAPEETPISEGKNVTLDDNGGTLNLKINETFLLRLGEGYDWNITIEDMTIISRVPNVLVVRGAQGLYRAHKPGRTNMTATGDPVCRREQPPCESPTREFHIEIIVAEAPAAPSFEILSAILALMAALWISISRKY